MKLRKILAGFLAGTMALTSSVVMSVTASAADTVIGTYSFANGWDFEQGISLMSESGKPPADDAKITFTLSKELSHVNGETGEPEDWVAIKIYDGSWGALQEVALSAGETSELVYVYSWKDDLNSAQTIVLQAGHEAVDVEISVSAFNEEYVEPTYDVWELNGEDKWEILLSKGAAKVFNFEDLTEIDPVKIDTITVDYTVDGACNGCIGTNDASLTDDPATEDDDESWAKATWDNNATSVTLDVDGSSSEAFQFQFWWVSSNGIKLVIDKITITEKAAPSTFDITAAEATNGKVEVTPATAEAEADVTVTVTPDEGYELDTLVVEGASGEVETTEGANAGEYTFKMPAEAVTVTATFKAIPVEYTITDKTAAEANGTIEISAAKAVKDTEITVKATAKAGYTLDAITVKTASDKDVTVTEGKFTMPEENVTVTATFKAIEATKIEVAPETANILVGKTATIEATVTPADALDKTVTWTSSDETIATVKDGVVTGVKAGSATITAKCGELTATVKVTVTEEEIPATEVKLDMATLELTEGDTATLKATATPENTTDEITWTSSDEKVATVKGGVVTAVAEGKATITVKCGEKTAACEVTVKALPTASDFVERLYTIFLDRESDEEGLKDWFEKLTSGEASAAEIVHGIAASPEFQAKGLTNEEVVELLYNAMLGRASDEAGKADWVKLLDAGMTVDVVINGFTASQEFAGICKTFGIKESGTVELTASRDQNYNLTAFISRMYTKALGRTYEVAGLEEWAYHYINNEVDADGLAYGFVFSPEFQNKQLSDSDYVDTLYRTFFNREPDEGGKADWLGRIANGTSREDVLKGFTGSQECANLVASFGLK